MRDILSQLARLNEALCSAARSIAGLLLVAMVVIVILQIVFRYVLNDSLSWTEEVSKTMMVWTAFSSHRGRIVSAPMFSIEIFVDEFPDTMRKIMALALNLLVLWIVAVFLFESFGFWQRGQAVRSDSLPIPGVVVLHGRADRVFTAAARGRRNNSCATRWHCCGLMKKFRHRTSMTYSIPSSHECHLPTSGFSFFCLPRECRLFLRC